MYSIVSIKTQLRQHNDMYLGIVSLHNLRRNEEKRDPFFFLLVNKLSAPCDNDLESGGMPKNLGSRRGSCVNLTLINSSTANMTSTAPTSVSNVISTKAKSAETSITDS